MFLVNEKTLIERFFGFKELYGVKVGSVSDVKKYVLAREPTSFTKSLQGR
jgi:hypothetical protein